MVVMVKVDRGGKKDEAQLSTEKNKHAIGIIRELWINNLSLIFCGYIS